MPAAAASSATSSQASLFLNPSPFIASPLFASFVAFRHKDAIISGRKKILKARISRSSSPLIVCESNRPDLPSLSVGNSGPHPLRAYTPTGKSFSSFGGALPLFGNQDGVVRGFPTLDRRQKSLQPPKAYKNDFFRFKYPVITEKPEWWWRTLACVPYLIALQISYTGYFLQPFVERYDSFGDVMYFVPGAISRLPVWFTMVYSYFMYIGIVRNKELPHFFRFHVMMGLLLEIALQVMWTASNFFPLIHYDGKFGIYYWAGMGLAYILVLLQCIRPALAGGYAHIPFVSDAAYIHTLFNIGGYQ